MKPCGEWAMNGARELRSRRAPFSWPIVSGRKRVDPFLASPRAIRSEIAYDFGQAARALIFAAFFCLAAALGGGARAAEVYPGCAEPGPTGKVWWVDPVNGKTPAEGGDGSQAHPWNSLNAVIRQWWFKPPQGYGTPAAVEHPLSSRC